jgi:hypothetical protein
MRNAKAMKSGVRLAKAVSAIVTAQVTDLALKCTKRARVRINSEISRRATFFAHAFATPSATISSSDSDVLLIVFENSAETKANSNVLVPNNHQEL